MRSSGGEESKSVMGGLAVAITTTFIRRCTITSVFLAFLFGCDRGPSAQATMKENDGRAAVRAAVADDGNRSAAAVLQETERKARLQAQPLRAGISFDEFCAFLLQRGPVHDIWPAPPTHQFTRSADSEIMAVTASIGHPTLFYYFIFVDGMLERIVDGVRPWMNEADVELSGASQDSLREWCRLTTAWTEQILAAPSIEIEQFERRVMEDLVKIETGPHDSEPASLFGAPIGDIALSPEIIEDYQAARARFDPFRLRCGMQIQDVEALMGASVYRQALDDDRTALVFGEAEREEVAAPWVLVVVRDEDVEAVFTNLFFTSALRELIEVAQTAGGELERGEPAEMTLAGQEVGR